MRTGFYDEDYTLAREITTAPDLRPSVVCDAAGKWAAVKVRKQMQRASANGDWNLYYTLSNLADDLERGEI